MTAVGVFGAVFDDDHRILCVRRAYAPNNWTLPGGRVEENESPILALVREVKEETGCNVKAAELIGVYAAPFKNDLVLLFECILTSREEWRPDDEIAQVSFFSADGLPEDFSPRTTIRVADAFAAERGVVRVFTDEADTGDKGR